MKWDEDKPKFWFNALSLVSKKSLDKEVTKTIPNFYDGVWFDDEFNTVYNQKKWMAHGTQNATDTFKELFTYVSTSKLPYKNNVFTYQASLVNGKYGPRLYAALFSECPEYDNSVKVVITEAEDLGEGVRDFQFSTYTICVTDKTLDVQLYGIKDYDGPMLFSYDKAKNELMYESEKDLSDSDVMLYALNNIMKLVIGLDLLHRVSTANDTTFSTLQPKLDPSKKFINLKRSKKGKPPICEWVKGVYDPKTSYTKITNIRGTHASPREHHRRGHWRTYKSGVRTWVRPAKVGNELNGVLRKTLTIGQSQER